MRIALVTEWFVSHEGGVASHVRELASWLRKKDVEVCIVTNEVKDEVNIDVEIIETPGPRDPLFKLNISPSLKSKLKDVLKDVDVVHSHHAFSRLPLSSIYVSHKLGIHSVLTTHTVSFLPELEYFWQAISYSYPKYRLRLKKVDRIIAVSNAAKRFIQYFTDREDIVVIPNGVDINRFKPREKKEFGKNLLYVGRIVPKKGLHVLLYAMKKVVEKDDEVKLRIAGKGRLLPLMKSLSKMLDIERNVNFLGYVPDKDLPELYRSSDLLILPSITGESFGITLLEAMASGLPVIGTNVGGVPEIINGCGKIVEPGKPNQLSRAILDLLKDFDRMKELGEKGRERVEKLYSWDVVGEKIFNVYKELVG
ncbi:MAG TPA: glycosyltransferase family 1 protein [Thermoplasmatales archaeon]|nr:glycosyltransferase family 1 protein [Thermoplasmatales archaeon]